MTMLPPDPVYIFKGEMHSVSCIEFQVTQQIQRMYAGTQSGNVHVWNLKANSQLLIYQIMCLQLRQLLQSKREIGCFKAGSDVCLSICIPHQQQQQQLITQTKSGSISIWTEAQAKWQLNTQINTDFFGFCKFQLFDGLLYIPIKSSKFHIMSPKTSQTLKTVALEWHTPCEVMAFKLCTIGEATLMLIAYEGHALALWDLHHLNSRSSLPLTNCPMALDFHVPTARGLCGDPTNKVLVFSLDKRLELKTERHITLTNAGVASVRVRPDGKLAAVGCWDGKLRLYSWKTLVLLAVLDTHTATVQDVAFTRSHAEGSNPKYLLAAASQDSRISLWDLYN